MHPRSSLTALAIDAIDWAAEPRLSDLIQSQLDGMIAAYDSLTAVLSEVTVCPETFDKSLAQH